MNLTGTPVDYFIAFLGGVIVSFTPCVYPLIPITVGYIGTNSDEFRLKGFFLSLIYVTGLAVTYSVLGLVASLTGNIFGKITFMPITRILVGAAIVVFGIFMFGFITVPLPKIRKRYEHRKGKYFSTFILGMISGLATSPCLTPVLASILFYLASKKSIAYGMSLLFSFAYGMGLLLILAGTFSSFLLNLPKSGKWSVYIQKIGALILIISGSFFIYNGIRSF